MGERYSWKDGLQENRGRFIEHRNRTVTDFLQLPEYIGAKRKICYRFLGFFGRDRAFDIDDLFQAADMKVMEIAERYPDKLAIMPYVKKAVQNAMFGLMKKRKKTLGEVCLAHEFEDGVPGPSLVVPIKDRGIERASMIDDLVYQTGEEFGPQAAENIKIFLDKCSDVYDLHLTKPPAIETKDRIKVVTAMDLSDEEMLVYAEVLLGTRERFKKGYLQCDHDDPEAKRRGVKYLSQVLEALGMSPKEFAGSRNKLEQLTKYRLFNYYNNVFDSDICEFVMALDSSLDRQDFFHGRKWGLEFVNGQEVIKRIQGLTAELKREPTGTEFDSKYPCMLDLFGHSPNLAIEFAYPGTYPEYGERAASLRLMYGIHSGEGQQKVNLGSEFLSGKSNTRLTKQQIDNIIELYSDCEFNAREASRMTGFSEATIRKYWEDNGLERKGRKGQGSAITPENIAEIVSSYERFEGKVRRAALALGYDRVTIKKYWEAHNLITGNRITQEEKEEIIVYYNQCDGNMSAAARHFSRGINTIRRYWLKEGLKANGKRGRPVI